MKTPSENINAYIEKAPEPQRTICKKLRNIIHKADPKVVEEWKWNSPYFTHNKRPLCWVWSFTHHASLSFYQGALMKDDKQLFNYGKENVRSRTIKFTDVEQIDEKALLSYVKEAVALNEAGKFVKVPVSKDKTVRIPSYIKKVLQQERLAKRFDEQIYTYRKGYVQWIEEAKQQETKEKRIRQMVKELHGGKVYMGMPIKVKSEKTKKLSQPLRA